MQFILHLSPAFICLFKYFILLSIFSSFYLKSFVKLDFLRLVFVRILSDIRCHYYDLGIGSTQQLDLDVGL